ncbi:MAG: YihY/virulence factor BrkB family protein [Actinomycetota bacterium]|nr:YihY/virulence factor BrkB family protein [Actinomycetota bacterium]
MRRLLPLARDTIQAFRELSLVTYASAIAFRALVALIPLTLLGLGLLGPLGLEGVWRDSLAPPIRERVTPEVFRAIDSSVERILREGGAGLIALASGLALWHLTMAMRVATVALNKIHREGESRPFLLRIATSVGLALATAICLFGSVLVVVGAPRVSAGSLELLLATLRWAVAVALLGLAVALVVRYAPSEQPQPRWASAGSALITGTWVVASLAFRWYVSSVADFTTAVGSLTVFLVLTAYVFTTSAIFLIGTQLDEVLRERRA